MLRSKRGQSTVEYIILVAGVIAVLSGLLGTPGSPFRGALDRAYQSAANGMENMANRLSASH